MKNLSLSVRIVCLILTLTISLSLAACSGSTGSSTPDEAAKTTSEYSAKLFDTSYVHTINITISDDDWNDLKANPTAKTKYKTDITIDGETVTEASLATKGNTSLTAVAEDKDSDRYSFKVNFGKYVDGQTYYGLNKLNLNNIYADATYMKDYLSYEIFRQAGVESPLTSYVWLTINGEDHGMYIAIEDVSESYLDRTQNGEGELYKPETEQFENMAQGGGQPNDNNNGGQQPPQGDMQQPQNGQNDSDSQNNNQPPQMPNGDNGSDRPEPPNGDMTPPNGFDPNNSVNGEMPTMPEGASPPDMPQGDPDNGNSPGGGFGSNAKGADLKYTDDELDSYSDIFDNDETKADEDSNRRVIAALKGLSQGENLEEYIDTEEVIRYFAAHNFVLSYDSYTGNMLHNYYLYEKEGKLSMLPWDYNLAFGAFGGGQGGKSGDSE
ncbi:MAG: CotH kinase family protein, partial [Ruminococcus sp.]|nr:CotH kinase family protein [Ruminococcus sp.]